MIAIWWLKFQNVKENQQRSEISKLFHCKEQKNKINIIGKINRKIATNWEGNTILM